jgi:tripartite-type tricarboxylate transporter receptor subunit TctC
MPDRAPVQGEEMITSRAGYAFAALSLLACLSAWPPAVAQTYPDRPIKIIVPVGPAGSYDIVGRLLADQLTKRLGQTVVVENRPGAGSIVGTQAVVASPPDGYTLLIGGLSNIVFNAGLYQKLSYDPLNDLEPVALVFNISYTLVGHKGLPYSTPKEIVEAARKNPGTLKVANAGVGTGQHVVGAAFQKITGTKMLEVSYRGSVAAFPDLLAGRVDLFFDSTPAAMPYIKSGQAKSIAILTAKRNPQMPDVPTMTE